MAEFDPRERIEGLACTTRAVGGLTERLYEVIFKREDATIEQIEAISWKRPDGNDYCKLPKGFAFNVKGIDYDSSKKAYVVTLILREQYLGDVTRYQEEIASKEQTIAEMTDNHAAALAEKDAAINTLNTQLAEADEAMIAMSTQLEEADETIISMAMQLEEADEAMIALYEQMEAGSVDTETSTEE